MSGAANVGSEQSKVQRATILVVDDTLENLTLLGEWLQPHYRVRAANNGDRALRIALSDPRPDLVLLDVMMPGMDGYAVMSRLRESVATRDIPVIFVTAMDSSESEERGLALGAVDYITKPINPAILLARVRTHLELKNARDLLRNQNDWLEHEVARRTSENVLVKNLTVRALACLAEARDNETGAHIVRTQTFVRVLAEHLQSHPRFAPSLGKERIELIVQAAPLHDVGKVGIPDAILLKPGKLTRDEFEIMKRHPLIGAMAIDQAMERTLSTVDDAAAEHATGAFTFLQIAHEISLGHHEKWDGTGYPHGRFGDEIPVSARLMALADVYDALTTRRVYKAPMSFDEATAIIVAGRGKHFDPAVVDAYLERRAAFEDIAQRYADDIETASHGQR